MTSDARRKLVSAMRTSLESPWIGLDQENMAREQMAHAADALEAGLPQQRDGRCWCEEHHAGYRWRRAERRWQGHGADSCWPAHDFCPRCGAELCADGIARRNADAARVERVRAELDLLVTSENVVVGFAANRIRAAIDGPSNALQSAAASTERRLAGDLSGYRDAAPGVAGDPDSARPEEVGASVSPIVATCECGMYTYHLHDAEDASWIGPSSWFRKHPTDPVADGTWCQACGTKMLGGGMRQTQSGITEKVTELEQERASLRIRAEQAEARAEELEQQVCDAYAALEWLRSGQIVVYTSPSGDAPYAWQAGSIQTERDFYAALSAATRRELTPPDLPQLFAMRRIDITGGQDPAEHLAGLYADEPGEEGEQG